MRRHTFEVQQHAMNTRRSVACPQCGARVEWAPGSRFRPFCSERCKLIDLGAWASESYRIPAKDGGEHEDRPADEGES